MCAIAGILGSTGENREILEGMLKTMTRRGPDQWGIFQKKGLSLLHARLAVVDLAGGRQPMDLLFRGIHYHMVYNGELYNTEELRRLLVLDGHTFLGHSDTEVVLHAYATNKQVTEVSDRITTIEEQKMLRLVITSSNGNIFKNGNVKTLLSAVVYSWDKDITDTLDANQFIWTRVSEDAEADKVWNEQHFGGAKAVVITSADVKVRATFYCDLIDTTTRQSLL